MAPETQTAKDRDEALRRVLVREADASPVPRTVSRGSTIDALPSSGPSARRVVLVTGIVAVLVVTVSVIALTAPMQRSGPAEPTTTSPSPSATPTVGQVLAVLSSNGTRKQTVTFAPEGMSFNIKYTCVGDGDITFSVPHNFTAGGLCNSASTRPGNMGRGNKGTAGSTTVTVTVTNNALKWNATITAVAPTFTTPEPIATPTTSSGVAARYCNSSDLTASYRTVQWLGGPDPGDAGEIALTNTSATTCFLYGQPQLEFVDSTGERIGGQAIARTDQRGIEFREIPPVELEPGHRGYVEVDAGDPSILWNKPTDPECPLTVAKEMRLSLATTLAGPAQRGTITVHTPAIHACTTRSIQLSNTIYVGYSATGK